MTKNLKDLKTAIQQAASRPKGIIVSPGMFKELNDAGLIQKKVTAPWGIPASEQWQIELPFHDNDIYTHVDPFRTDEDSPFTLPPSSARP